MAVKKVSRREHSPVKASRQETRRRAAQLAPPEERARQGSNQARRDGAAAVDTGELKVPDALLHETDASAGRAFRLEPVVIFILACALAYIAFIIYLISSGQAQ